jgi:hypothetical protein
MADQELLKCPLKETFDKLQLCYSILFYIDLIRVTNSQLKHIYRHGHLRSCLAERNDFMFCVKMFNKSAEEIDVL